MSTIRRRVGAVLTAVILGSSMALPGTLAALAAPTPDATTASPASQTTPVESPSTDPTVTVQAPLAAPTTASTAPQLAPSSTEPSAAVAAAALSEGEQAIQDKAAASVDEIGTAVSAIECGLVDGGCYQRFQYGSIYWSPSTGAHYVKGAILSKWAQTGYENGDLGYPQSDEECGLAQGGCLTDFQNGTIYWTSSTGAHFVKGAIRSKWASMGWENSVLGYPQSDEKCGLTQGGCLSDFQNGTIYWTSSTGAHFVKGAIRTYWAAAGWENSKYGYPKTDELCRTGTGGELCYNDFQVGTIKWRSGVGIIDCSRLRCVALTFDDGPGPYTSQLLDTLDAQNVQSTFFVVGQNVGNYPSTEQRAFRNGNEVMNHSWSHPDLTTLSYSSIVSQLSSTSNVIQSTVGKRPTLMRPPYGAYNSTVTSIARDQGMAVILWNIDTLDWKYRDSAYVRNAAVANTTSGSIVLMHDIHPTTVNAVPGIISDLKARGYTLVTVTDLIGAPQPGVVYSRR